MTDNKLILDQIDQLIAQLRKEGHSQAAKDAEFARDNNSPFYLEK